MNKIQLWTAIAECLQEPCTDSLGNPSEAVCGLEVIVKVPETSDHTINESEIVAGVDNVPDFDQSRRDSPDDVRTEKSVTEDVPVVRTTERVDEIDVHHEVACVQLLGFARILDSRDSELRDERSILTSCVVDSFETVIGGVLQEAV